MAAAQEAFEELGDGVISMQPILDAAKEAGVEITGFVRLEVGEGIEKEEVDFAAEVAAAAGTGKA